MSYLIADPSEIGPRKWKIVDMIRFGHDLAAALGWGIVIGEYGAIDLNSPDEKLRLHLHNPVWTPVRANKVDVSISVTDIPIGDQASLAHGPQYELPNATVSADRPMDKIARDIKRRVIDAAVEPAEHRRQYAAERLSERGSLKVAMDELKALFGDNIKFNEQHKSNDSCPFNYYYRGGGSNTADYGKFYLNGRVNADGSLYVERMSNISLETLAALVTAAIGKS